MGFVERFYEIRISRPILPHSLSEYNLSRRESDFDGDVAMDCTRREFGELVIQFDNRQM